ncbi:MAG: 3-ketoacyl-ACP reductase FabG2 [Candidatus Accumulibacter sp.]|jgi:3-oxoacyl-[acyl-carrier protein] reductase|nr:3-ketoacyl-ACP reductase FabG2 [Accumulibacter sp.]
MKPRRILVTGSSRGVGRAIATRLAKDGFPVTVCCRAERAEADKVAAEIVQAGGRANVLQFDVCDREGCREVLGKDVKENGAYYGIVCNAGITRDNIFPALSGEDWDNVIDTNLGSFFNVVHPLVMPLVRLGIGGRILALASVSGMAGNRGQVNYSAAKAGLIGATKALAVELASRKVTVNCLAPGFIETEMTENLPIDQIKKHIPMNRLGRADEVAAAASFLMSDDASYITRQIIAINGGII